MRSYDSVDATPLFLMVAYRYAAVGDAGVAAILMPAIRRAIEWLTEWADHDGDGFVDYLIDADRRAGGLAVQSWMDSTESAFFENADDEPVYPIAPVEVQAYAWTALMLWGDYFSRGERPEDQAFGEKLLSRARDLKRAFNSRFILRHANGRFAGLAFAIDGTGRPLISARSSIGHVLFAAVDIRDGVTDGVKECILESRYVPMLRGRLMSRDLFVPQAGIRTLSTKSRRFDPISYHNGSIWPHDTAMLASGLDNFGYAEDARRVRRALLNAFGHFKTPVELFGYRRGFRPYAAACQTQAWSASALLLTLATEGAALA
jgi:glycogen debranching enzyme